MLLINCQARDRERPGVRQRPGNRQRPGERQGQVRDRAGEHTETMGVPETQVDVYLEVF